MKKLILFSDQITKENEKINSSMLELISKDKPKIGYIPSCGDKDRKYFNYQFEFYKSYGIQEMMFFDLDSEFDNIKIDELLSCDAIHLSAGDPIVFLNNIKKRSFAPILCDYAEKKGVLIGVSGGAVQLGLNAGLFKVFTENLSSAIENLNDFVTLGLSNFEFLPHYNRWDKKYKNSVKEYSRIVGNTIYACNDGDGIVINGDSIGFIGDIVKIDNGSEINLESSCLP